MRNAVMLFMMIALGLAAVTSQGQSVDAYQPRQVLAKPIRAIIDPPRISAEESHLRDNELVLGVVLHGKARAYPINQLTGPSREIVNDRLGGVAIAATW